MGPSLLGRFAPAASAAIFAGVSGKNATHGDVLGFVYDLGLILLMFLSGAEARGLLGRNDRKQVAWLATVGTGLPFLIVLATSHWLPLGALMGPARQRSSVLLVVGIAVAVTSIPVISRIFFDLGIMRTRFARLVLGVAVIEDVALWAVLAIATALAQSGKVAQAAIAQHMVRTVVYFAVGLLAAPRLLLRLSRARWNVLARSSPVAFAVAVLLGYAGLAAALDVSLVFAAFLAGFALADREPHATLDLAPLRKVAFGLFIPVYFAIVGYKLDLGTAFSFSMLALFLVGAMALKLATVGAGARLAGYRGLDALNLAMATNARGGPGIVLASVAFDAGIINAPFYTTLVLVAVLTSQAAGAWLDFVLRRGWPLLSASPEETPLHPVLDAEVSLPAA